MNADLRLQMIGEAYEVHDADPETGEVCCSATTPCETRRALQLAEVRISGEGPDPRLHSTDQDREVRTGGQRSARTVADPASEAQVRFIEKLAGERDLTALADRHAKNLDKVRTAPDQVSKRVASALITALKAAGQVRTAEGEVRTSDLATEAQVRLLQALVGPQTDLPADLTRTDASKLIDGLKAAGRTPQEVRTSGPDLEDGMYRLATGEVYKVQTAVHGSGRQYAKKLVALDEPRELKRGTRTHEFAYEAGAIRKLTAADRMTLEQAAEFGALYGTCACCGLTLTDEKSIAAGIGPKCAEKF